MRTLFMFSLALSSTALASNDRTPPGLERVCEQIQPEVTTSEVLTSSIEAATNPPTCDLLAERGICLFNGASLAVTSTKAAGVVPVRDTIEGDNEYGELAYVTTFFDLQGSDEPTHITINGAVLTEGEHLDGPIVIESYVQAAYSDTRLPRNRWTHVLVSHGNRSLQVYTSPSTVPAGDAGVTVTGKQDPGGRVTFSNVTIRVLDDDVGSLDATDFIF